MNFRTSLPYIYNDERMNILYLKYFKRITLQFHHLSTFKPSHNIDHIKDLTLDNVEQLYYSPNKILPDIKLKNLKIVNITGDIRKSNILDILSNSQKIQSITFSYIDNSIFDFILKMNQLKELIVIGHLGIDLLLKESNLNIHTLKLGCLTPPDLDTKISPFIKNIYFTRLNSDEGGIDNIFNLNLIQNLNYLKLHFTSPISHWKFIQKMTCECIDRISNKVNNLVIEMNRNLPLKFIKNCSLKIIINNEN